MIFTTTSSIKGKKLSAYLGIVTSELVVDDCKDFTKKIEETRNTALDILGLRASKLGANAVIGIDIDCKVVNYRDYEVFMVFISGTAVSYE